MSARFLKRAKEFGTTPEGLLSAVIRNEIDGKVKLLDFTEEEHKAIAKLRRWERAIKKLVNV